MMPNMTTYHVTVNGVPACESELTLGIDPPTSCAHSTAEAAVETVIRIKKARPEAEVRAVRGRCPTKSYSRHEEV